MKDISTMQMVNSEYIALSAIEITSIPNISILTENTAELPQIIEQYKLDMSGFLREVYQMYKTYSINAAMSKDISLEFLWTTSAVKNQPYNAEIRIFLIDRSIE